ncbi:hypothetical protein M0R72_06190 [Candidatus Pacearchaeota archaeon]|jgi:hypothetical protein|nr:hypothetical protein [Candidatus Pacearchaeota archaeon]
MNFLSAENLAAYLSELWDGGDLAVAGNDVSVDWNLWEDAGDYPNNLAARPLPPGPWYVDRVNGSFTVSFTVPKAWVAEANGEVCFKFDDEGPCAVAAFILEDEGLFEVLSERVMEAVRDAMIAPAGYTVDDSLDSFAVALGEVTLAEAGRETKVEIEARVESV